MLSSPELARPTTCGVRRCLQQLIGDLCLTVYNQSSVAADQRLHLLRSKGEPYVNICLRQLAAQKRYTLLCDVVSNQEPLNARCSNFLHCPIKLIWLFSNWLDDPAPSQFSHVGLVATPFN